MALSIEAHTPLAAQPLFRYTYTKSAQPRDARRRRAEKERFIMKTIQLFTDGACSGNPGPGGWGVVLRW